MTIHLGPAGVDEAGVRTGTSCDNGDPPGVCATLPCDCLDGRASGDGDLSAPEDPDRLSDPNRNDVSISDADRDPGDPVVCACTDRPTRRDGVRVNRPGAASNDTTGATLATGGCLAFTGELLGIPSANDCSTSALVSSSPTKSCSVTVLPRAIDGSLNDTLFRGPLTIAVDGVS